MVIVHLSNNQRRVISTEKGETVSGLCERFCKDLGYPSSEFEFYSVSTNQPLPLNLSVKDIKEVRLKRKEISRKGSDDSSYSSIDDKSPASIRRKIAPLPLAPSSSSSNATSILPVERTVKRAAPQPPTYKPTTDAVVEDVDVYIPSPPSEPIMHTGKDSSLFVTASVECSTDRVQSPHICLLESNNSSSIDSSEEASLPTGDPLAISGRGSIDNSHGKNSGSIGMSGGRRYKGVSKSDDDIDDLVEEYVGNSLASETPSPGSDKKSYISASPQPFVVKKHIGSEVHSNRITPNTAAKEKVGMTNLEMHSKFHGDNNSQSPVSIQKEVIECRLPSINSSQAKANETITKDKNEVIECRMPSSDSSPAKENKNNAKKEYKVIECRLPSSGSSTANDMKNIESGGEKRTSPVKLTGSNEEEIIEKRVPVKGLSHINEEKVSLSMEKIDVEGAMPSILSGGDDVDACVVAKEEGAVQLRTTRVVRQDASIDEADHGVREQVRISTHMAPVASTAVPGTSKQRFWEPVKATKQLIFTPQKSMGEEVQGDSERSTAHLASTNTHTLSGATKPVQVTVTEPLSGKSSRPDFTPMRPKSLFFSAGTK